MNEKLAVTQETDVLGMTFSTDKKDMYEKNKTNLSSRTKLAVRKINKFMTNLTFLQWTTLWNSFVGGRVMAAGSELLVDYTFIRKSSHKTEFSYDTQYRNYFWNKHVPDTYTIEDIPLMPSQQLLSNAIKLVVIIDLGKYSFHGYDVDEHIPIPDETIRIENRTSNMPRMQQSISRMNHHKDLSIVRKHWQAVSEFYRHTNCSRENLKKLCTKALGRQIDKFIKIALASLNIFRHELLRNEMKWPYGPYMIENNPQSIECREVQTQQ